MKKTRVLQVIGNLSVGGAENVAMNLYRYINREKFEFHYLVYGKEVGYYESEVEDLGGKVIHMEEPSKNYMNFTKKLKNIMKKYGPFDIVHSHTLFNSGLVLETARRLGIKKRIAHSHSIKNKIYTNSVLQMYEKIMRHKIRKNATDYLACSQEAGDFLFGELEFRKNGSLMKNGIDTFKYRFSEDIRNKVRNEFNLTNKFVIGHVGHLSSVKNQLFLIEIIKDLVISRDDLVLMLVGEGNDREKITSLIKDYKLDSYIIMTGNRDDVHEMLCAMDVFVFPSLYEGLGLAVIEAQSTGLPCIVSDMVPKEAFLTNIIEEVSLAESSNYWKGIIAGIYKNESREDYYREIEKKEYDIRNINPFLESLYSLEE